MGLFGMNAFKVTAEIISSRGQPSFDIVGLGDLAVQEGVKRLLALEEHPAEKATRALAEGWSPQRGAMAIFTWHFYANPAL